MNIYIILSAGLGVLASVHARDPTQPANKYIDFSKLTRPPSAAIDRNMSIHPTRPDPRQPDEPTSTFPPASTKTADPGPWVTKTIGHDEIKPFPQPDPVTISEKVGVKFKPQIQIRTGCVPYPVVNEFGETSGGLQTSGSPRGGCRGSVHGSQVYGRSAWINGFWAIMYSWYFPKDSPSSRMGHRHDWEFAVVFIDNPGIPEPKIIGCSVSSHDGRKKYNPCPSWVIDGNSLKVRYKHAWPMNHDLDVTGDAGTFQDLIMWDQMTDDARRALNSVSFGKANTPFNDGKFLPTLESAWAF
ncbi:hypothetical protein L916_02304 [Phytophthora nicotianae]|uniref:Necrosis inducing protein n=1 Tax=Phytophthora nicotianae TaxID=4792 RepID=W2JNR1_PHYNI|nr:hypothetical protein L916_02304 [Phytophthora nicotianae]